VPAEAREYCEGLSLCYAEDNCRKRTTPPSLRFLGRRVYVAVTMLLISVMLHGGTRAQLSELSREFGVNRHTVARCSVALSPTGSHPDAAHWASSVAKMTRSRPRVSLYLDVGHPNYLPPLLGFAGDELAEIGG
jgi:hypothetical protein